jgi:hypothetical protein
MSRIPRKPALVIDGNSFDEWMNRLRAVVASQRMSFLLDRDEEHCRELWIGGLSPTEAAEDLIADIRETF